MTFTIFDLAEYSGTAAGLSPLLAMRYAQEFALTDDDLTLLSDEARHAVSLVRPLRYRSSGRVGAGWRERAEGQ